MSELLIYFLLECCTLPVIKGFFDIFLVKKIWEKSSGSVICFSVWWVPFLILALCRHI